MQSALFAGRNRLLETKATAFAGHWSGQGTLKEIT